ncbi:MAG: winged-helix domain-containing protein, partial [Fibrobacter sp.]|nr:winged-helix domain-containing protein [Fibrobacter sp.]
MKKSEVSKAALGRIPMYLRYLKSLPKDTGNISATAIAKNLGFGDVQVRKDLGAVCGSGKPKVGYMFD